jgi:hypothetical protein
MRSMDLVLLQDIQGGYASNWARIANTAGVKDIHIGDRFREQGFGPGAEELEVAGSEISPIGGASRLFFHRAANATQPMPHRLGAVLEQVGVKPAAVDPAYQPLRETVSVASGSGLNLSNTLANGSASAATVPASEAVASEPLASPKRGRGRPPGSKNKAKEEVAFPAGF